MKRKRNWQKSDGKPARLPIIRKLVVGGEDRELRLDEGDITRCWRCGSLITIMPHNTTRFPDGMQYVECPTCRIKISALYCYENAVRRQGADLRDRQEEDEMRKFYE